MYLKTLKFGKQKKEAENAANDYIPWLLEECKDDVQEMKLEIRSVFKDKKGKLHDRIVDKIRLQKVPEDIDMD